MTDGITTTMPVAPVNNANDGIFGNGNGSWVWIILLFALLGNNGGGLFGGGATANGATNLINNDFLYTQQKIDNLGQAIINQTNQLNQSLNSGINSVNSGICNLGHQIDMGFCQTNRNVDSVKFQMSQDKCDITNAVNASTQTLLSYLTGQEIANWRERALSAENRENNANQTAAIVNAIRPYPQAAYLTSNPQVPFGSYGGYGYPGGFPQCSPAC